jgi:hypothetical protein
VEHDNQVTGLGVALTIAGCAFATFVLGALGWVAIKALGFVF